MFCRHCGYNLHGLPANRCPECGHAFDPHDPKTYWQHAASLTRRRWAKRIIVALLTLLILATAAGVSLWYPWHREQAAMQMVQRVGGRLWTETVGPQWLQRLLGRRAGFLLIRVKAVTLDSISAQVTITDADLTTLDGLSRLRQLYFWQTPVTDTGLAHLRNLKRLQWLNLRATKVTDAGLEYLKDFNGLQVLDLTQTQVTDAGLTHLKRLNGLRELDLNFCRRVTDAGLDDLKALPGLKYLGLRATKVTDVGLEHLKELKQLQSLDLADTKVTDEGAAKLKKSLPNCNIWH